MEMEDVHASKRFRTQNGIGIGGVGVPGAGQTAAAKMRQKEMRQEEDENGEVKSRIGRGGKGAIAEAAALGALRAQWHQYSSTASRICRVSRASGGKDRHSKVLTAKGLRDRRVRLSVSTAIQFYDLQDRLGYDQPSKAVEWLIKAAAAAISDLPSLDGAFPDEGNPPQMSEEQEDPEVAELEHADYHQRQEQQQQHVSLTKSACSSTSETSKGSVLSLSRSGIRIKARERARERTATAKEKEKDGGDEGAQFASVEHHQSLNLHPSSQSSFIELLTCGSQQNQNQTHSHDPVPNLIPKQLRRSPTSPAIVKADFFGQVGLFGEGEKPQQPTVFSSQTHFNIAAATASATRDHPQMQQPQQQQFSFMPEHLIPLAVTAAGGDYINFSISSGIAGFNRGTLQSNFAPPQPNHHLQRLSSPVDGSNLPFLSGAAPASSAPWDGPFPAGFDSRLQLCYDGYRHSDLKGKGKS
ncbi:hypothetical protein Taro_018241 [Colocasia esculenta]|uniref:CINCINNATA1 n=1 Tax=Colocasia esculenta TaxID=4460 RepID=A0A843UQG4_COLES|nr:hypothetical protein [Colocasia esculenta]